MPTTTQGSRLRELLANLLRGIAMGTFDVIPGVSGGTVALIAGIYERLIGSLRAGAGFLLAAVRFDAEGLRRRWQEIDWALLLPLLAGVAGAILTLARVIEPLLDDYPVQMRALFSGLILASLAVPFRRISAHTPTTVGALVAAVVVAFVLTGLPPGEISDPNLLLVFGAAAVALTAMILPGVSGAFLLMAMGMYAPTLAALNDRDLGYVAVFMAGGIVGLGVMAKVIGYLLETRHDLTMSVLLGLMIVALRALWPWQDAARGLQAPVIDGTFLPAMGMAVAGFVAVSAMIMLGQRSLDRT